MTKNWQIKKLGEVCEIRSGKNQKNVINPNGKYPIYGSSGVFGFADEYICDENTTIIGRKGTINSPLFVTTKFWNVDTAFGLCAKETLLPKMLYYFCLGFNFKKLDKSTTIPSLAKTDLVNISIPIPDLPTQRAIVAKIEELFSALDKSVEELKTAQEQLKVYRQSVLKWAFESIKKPSIKTIEEICAKIVDCLHSTAKFKNEGKLCVDTTCIENGKILFDKIRYVDDETYEKRISRLKPKEGDILFSREGTVGTTLIVPPGVDLCLGQRMMMFRLNEIFNSKYIMYFFQSPIFQSQYQPLIMGTTAPHLNIRDIKKFKVITTSNIEQHHIVQEIERRLSVADKMEESLSASLLQAEQLRQSILKKAFLGELV